MVTPEVQRDIEKLLYEEARLLDNWKLHEWLELLTEDVRYWMPVRENLPAAEEPVELDELAFNLYDEDHAALLLRVRRLDTGMAHVEEPRSITRHLISNVLVRDGERQDEVITESNFLVMQLRRKQHESYFTGTREDVLRRVNGAWKIARRKIMLDQMVLPRTVSIFF